MTELSVRMSSSGAAEEAEEVLCIAAARIAALPDAAGATRWS